VCAQEARFQLGLDRVLLMPVSAPPHKRAPGDPGAEERLELCRLAAEGEPGVEASDLEVLRGGASYTVDTLRSLHEAHPGDELTFIVGGDMARSLPAWREPAEILRLARLAVAEREGAGRADIEAALAPIAAGDRIRYFDMPRIDVSSSAVRARVASGAPLRHLVPDTVLGRIAERHLYADAGGAGA
jgi:nicotinate-nucleotide adenylyltransferase